MSTTTLTPAQSAMLDVVKTSEVRLDRAREYWLIGGKRATGAQARVINALQEKKLVTWKSVMVTIQGRNDAVRREILAAR